jgi:hypothetical protein
LSEKGYIHKNSKGRWELNFIISVEPDIDGTQHVVVEKYNDYPNWKAAFYALQKKQLGYK